MIRNGRACSNYSILLSLSGLDLRIGVAVFGKDRIWSAYYIQVHNDSILFKIQQNNW